MSRTPVSPMLWNPACRLASRWVKDVTKRDGPPRYGRNIARRKTTTVLPLFLLLLGVFLGGTAPPFQSEGPERHVCACCGDSCMCGPDASCGCRPHIQSGGSGAALPFTVVPPAALRSIPVTPPLVLAFLSSVRVAGIRFLLPGPETPPPKSRSRAAV
jgi:hypothetical protein